MAVVAYFNFLPKEVEMIIYSYEHQLKMQPVLDDIKNLCKCIECKDVVINPKECNSCNVNICNYCTYIDRRGNTLCCFCDNYRDEQLEEQYYQEYIQDLDEEAEFYRER